MQVLVNEFCLILGFLLLPFLTQFPHIQGQGFGNKMYISELFIVVGYLHTAGFKTAEELIFPSVYIFQCYLPPLGP